MILAEKVYGRREVLKGLEKWLRNLVREAAEIEIRLEEGPNGWIILTPDDELIGSMINLQTKINPIAVGRPPFPARVLKLTDSKIILEYPTEEGMTVTRTFSTSSFAASLGCSGGQPRAFLELAGICENAPISLAAENPSFIQLKLLLEQILRGLDRIMVLNANPQEVDKAISSSRLRGLIVIHEPLTLLAHMLYVRLGARLEKVAEKVREEVENISRGVLVKPLSWKMLLEAVGSGKEPFFLLGLHDLP